MKYEMHFRQYKCAQHTYTARTSSWTLMVPERWMIMEARLSLNWFCNTLRCPFGPKRTPEEPPPFGCILCIFFFSIYFRDGKFSPFILSAPGIANYCHITVKSDANDKVCKWTMSTSCQPDLINTQQCGTWFCDHLFALINITFGLFIYTPCWKGFTVTIVTIWKREQFIKLVKIYASEILIKGNSSNFFEKKTINSIMHQAYVKKIQIHTV